MRHPGRPAVRHGVTAAVVALLLALVLGGLFGCGARGAPPDGRRATAPAQIPRSPSTGPQRRAAPKPARPWNVHPASVAALGDSITRGFDACDPLADCPEVSWATGSRAGVGSLSSRLPVGTAGWNLAESGARVGGLTAQARAAAAHRPAMVTVLIGANDACTASVAAMTPVARFRADFTAALAYLHRVLPDTQILVASIPDLRRLWSVGRTNVLGRQIWKLGLCPSMLKDAEARTPAADARRTAVRDRVIAYNAAMGGACARLPRCRYDNGAVFGYRFTTHDLSRWDWFHPNATGEAKLAALLAGVAGFRTAK
ncbi:SGNH/GDSL hydrolase family protein [Actinacidiphila sp. ITFR-21]|uniref:SGNH/GDSL hydrolase family protein n=1 Tax=Actinacidiphila sp. ITFR-21 TaxID=3075199 RepID=UPI00288A1A24|nr:SGNH/GDSL hydrolase family protein [Streptomyces sp. ITFR-21]WNI15375.1 GDSL-type esterase/lipase family protein [Streptomyces sp. ITFR-21]